MMYILYSRCLNTHFIGVLLVKTHYKALTDFTYEEAFLQSSVFIRLHGFYLNEIYLGDWYQNGFLRLTQRSCCNIQINTSQ